MISHHASLGTLRAYAAGSLPEALGLVVATHAAYCPVCRRRIAGYEAEQGNALDGLPPSPLMEGALERVLARLDAPFKPTPPLLHPSLPPPLNRVPMGRWWLIAPGMRWRPLRTGGPGWAGLLLIAPKRAIPPHRHVGLELTCVLAGSFDDGPDIYRPGDLTEPIADHDRPLSVVGDEPCLCILGSEGLRLKGPFGHAQRGVEWVARRAGLMRGAETELDASPGLLSGLVARRRISARRRPPTNGPTRRGS